MTAPGTAGPTSRTVTADASQPTPDSLSPGLNRHMIRILVVVDHPLVRIGASALLRQQEHMEVVGECADLSAALTLTLERRPDVVLLGLRSPGPSVADATRQLISRLAGLRVIVMASYPARLAAEAAAQAGASAYLPDTGSPFELVQTVRNVATGETEWAR